MAMKFILCHFGIKYNKNTICWKIGGIKMKSNYLDILFDTDSLSADQIKELESFGANLMDLYR